MNEAWVILETSGRGGAVGLAGGGQVQAVRRLDPARRHNRDLAPTVRELLEAATLSPQQLHGVMVSLGPGSYTGLRVGVMSAKALSWATGCRLIAVPTLPAIAEGVPGDASVIVDVIADALQGLVYAQRFAWNGERWQSTNELHIDAATTWAAGLSERSVVIGPGVPIHRSVIPNTVRTVIADCVTPSIENLFRTGTRLAPVSESELALLEPLYLRGSSAEEKAKSSSIPG